MTDAQNNITGFALLLNGKTTGCDIMLYKSLGRPISSRCDYAGQGGSMDVYKEGSVYEKKLGRNVWYPGWNSAGPTAGAMFAHELGHLKGCLHDEYDEQTRLVFCGHSLMGDESFVKDMCGERNHGKDGEYQKFTVPGGPTYGWKKFSSVHQVWIKRTATPDPSDYYDMVNFDQITPVIEFPW
ncbi:MAG: hypothetical protein HY897_22730 [Deltaproteobacteria bacterium]|nr:hypothetical protein [Deltaproteobacteria bacterium]